MSNPLAVMVGNYRVAVVRASGDIETFPGFDTEAAAHDWAMENRQALGLGLCSCWRVEPNDPNAPFGDWRYPYSGPAEPFLREHGRRPTVKRDGVVAWLKDEIAHLESIERTEFGNGSLSAYKSTLEAVTREGDAVMSEHGDFPPGEPVTIRDAVFVRTRTGAIEVSVPDGTGDLEVIGRMDASYTTRKEAQAWLDGQLDGYDRGARDGRMTLQAKMRSLLGVA